MTAPPAAPTPDELDRIEALAKAATPGPWRWNLNRKSKTVSLESLGRGSMLETVIDFVRWGMSGAAPRFRRPEPAIMAHCQAWARNLPGRDHHSEWCQTIDHPDAAYLAALSPDVVQRLVDEIRTLRTNLAEQTHFHKVNRDGFVAMTRENEALRTRVAALEEELHEYPDPERT